LSFHRSGFTLLETLLSIALASLVIYLVSMAIDLHLRVLDRRRHQVEEAQLARAVLRQMADDLQSVVYPVSTDAAQAASASSSQTSASSGQTSASSGQTSTSSGQSSGSSGQTSASSGQTLSLIPSKPGLYGDQYQIQVDVSRLPRRDEYVVWQDSDEGNLLDAVSDVKSVAYYLQADESGTSASAASGSRSGLFRRVLDRAATKWAMENGNYEGLHDRAQLLAPEVIGLEFRYFDGLTWYEQWDSETYGSLPIAVEIAVALAPSASDGAELQAADVAGSAADIFQGDRGYRLLVRLPTADVSTTGQSATGTTGATSP
jgi:type II secretory pathway component PulJ